jgi:LacI family transcriptional regulator
MKKHVTIRDVAEKTGYSMQTVSRVLNGRDDLHTEKTSKKIKAVANAMGYVQNIYAKAMKGSRTWSVGIIIDPFFGSFSKDIFVGAHDELLACGYFPILLLNNRMSDVDLVNTLATRRVEGVMILPNPDMDQGPFIAKAIKKHQLPLVSLDCPLTKTQRFDSVVTADEHGGTLAAQHLWDMGHRRLAGIFLNHQGLLLRKKGFEHYIHSRGGYSPQILIDNKLIYSDDHTQPIQKFLAKHADITAIFSSTDHLLPAIYRAASNLGRSIPDELSIIGFGDLDITAHLNPPTSTLRQNAEIMGQQAARLLIERIENPLRNIPPRNIQFEPELIARASVAPHVEAQQKPKQRR